MRALGMVLVIVALGCPSEVIGPPGSTGGDGGASASSGSASSASSGTAGGGAGAQPQNCWGCASLGEFYYSGDLPSNICPGALELYEEKEGCICAHCSHVCGQCGTFSGPSPNCASCAYPSCQALVDACGADKRLYDSSKE